MSKSSMNESRTEDGSGRQAAHGVTEKDKKKRGLAKMKTWFEKNPDLKAQPYYHGKLPREEIESEQLLQRDGDFLVRESDKHEIPMILAVFWEGKVVYVPMVFDEEKQLWHVYGKGFKTIPELLMYHVKTQKPVGTSSKARIMYPISKDAYNLDVTDIEVGKQLGSGQFGVVRLGKLKRKRGDIDVAIKQINLQSADKEKLLEEKKNLLAEARIMKRYRHRNVVRFIGICVMEDPVMIVLEYCPGGSLDAFLRKHENMVRSEQLLRFCVDAARGMRYLEAMDCIHRDLAARNCLLSIDNEAKIADFGLSREGSFYQVASKGPMPVRWCAPEIILHRQWSHKSDIWGFGILMWEIYSNAAKPYPDIGGNIEVAQRVAKGHTLAKPARMPAKVDRIMQDCFAYKPAERPDFKEVYAGLKKFFTLEYGTPKS